MATPEQLAAAQQALKAQKPPEAAVPTGNPMLLPSPGPELETPPDATPARADFGGVKSVLKGALADVETSEKTYGPFEPDAAPKGTGFAVVRPGIDPFQHNPELLAKSTEAGMNAADLRAAQGSIEAQHQAELSTVQQQLSQQYAQAAEAANAKRMAQQAELEKRHAALEKQADELTKMKVDEGNFWSNPGNLGSAIIMAMMPAFSKNYAGRGLDLVNRAIQQDLEVQKANIANAKSAFHAKQNTLQQFRDLMGDAAQGDMLYLARSKELAAMKMQELASKFGSPMARAKGLEQAEEMKSQVLDHRYLRGAQAYQQAMIVPKGMEGLHPRVPGGMEAAIAGSALARQQRAQQQPGATAPIGPDSGLDSPPAKDAGDRASFGGMGGAFASIAANNPKMAEAAPKALAALGGPRKSIPEAAQSAVAKKTGPQPQAHYKNANSAALGKDFEDLQPKDEPYDQRAALADIDDAYKKLEESERRQAAKQGILEHKGKWDNAAKATASKILKVNQDKAEQGTTEVSKRLESTNAVAVQAQELRGMLAKQIAAFGGDTEKFNEAYQKSQNGTIRDFQQWWKTAMPATEAQDMKKAEAFYNLHQRVASIAGAKAHQLYGVLNDKDKKERDVMLSGAMDYTQLKSAIDVMDNDVQRERAHIISTAPAPVKIRYLKNNPDSLQYIQGSNQRGGVK